jgi:N-dimethylarginine dimethylaminohydrolase
MTQIHCWNEYDSLKTIILGSVFDNDKVPIRYIGKDQENFIKLNEETNVELDNFQKILEQNGVSVLRPKQPKNYNGIDLPLHDPTINMRDFFLAYGNMFFTTYGPYQERRYQQAWIEEIINKINLNNNLIVNSPEINLENDNFDFESLINFHEYYSIAGFKEKDIPKNLREAKIFFVKNEKNNPLGWEYFKLHSLFNKNKIMFHTANVIKRNNKAYISSYDNLSNGHIWFDNWLKHLNIEPIYIPKVSHIDGSLSFLNNETLLLRKNAWDNLQKPIESYFPDVKNIIYSPFLRKPLPFQFKKEMFNPTQWLTKWKHLCSATDNSVNCLVINPQKVIFCFYDKDFYSMLKNYGIEAIYVKWSNAPFWEGSLHCITCDIERRAE